MVFSKGSTVPCQSLPAVLNLMWRCVCECHFDHHKSQQICKFAITAPGRPFRAHFPSQIRRDTYLGVRSTSEMITKTSELGI